MPSDKFWRNIYKESEELPWDLGRVSPALADLFEHHPPKAASKLMVPGCGLGHDAVYLASLGHEVTAVDFVEDALDSTEELARQVGVQITTAQVDVLVMRSTWRDAFDVVAEHTCYAAIHPTERDKYIAQLKRVLKPGGTVMGVFFDVEKFDEKEGAPDGPPYPSTQASVKEHFEKLGFKTELLEPTPRKHGEKPHAQFVAIFRREE